MTKMNMIITGKRQLVTAVWRNGGFSAPYDSFVIGSSAVLRLNFLLEIRHYAKPQTVICYANRHHNKRQTKIKYGTIRLSKEKRV